MNYMIADLKNERNIGSFNHREWRSYNRILLTQKSVGFSGNRKFTFPENIEDSTLLMLHKEMTKFGF